MKITKIVVVLYCLIFGQQVLANENSKVKVFSSLNLVSLENILNKDKAVEVIEKEGLPIVIGRMIHVEAKKGNVLNGLNLSQFDYGKAVASYNALPLDLTPEMVINIRDERGLHFLPADYKEGDVHPSVVVDTSILVPKPGLKPELPIEVQFAKRLQQVDGLQKQVAEMKAATEENKAFKNVVKDLEDKLNNLSETFNSLEERQGALTEELMDKISLSLDETIKKIEILHNKLLTNVDKKLDKLDEKVNGVESETKKRFVQVEDVNSVQNAWLIGLTTALAVLISVIVWFSLVSIKPFSTWVKKTLADFSGRVEDVDTRVYHVEATQLGIYPTEEEKELLKIGNTSNLKNGETIVVNPELISDDRKSSFRIEVTVSGHDDKYLTITGIPKDSSDIGVKRKVFRNTNILDMINKAVRKKYFEVLFLKMAG